MRPVGLWRIVVLLIVITPIDFGETKRTWRRLHRLGGVHRVRMGAGGAQAVVGGVVE